MDPVNPGTLTLRDLGGWVSVVWLLVASASITPGALQDDNARDEAER